MVEKPCNTVAGDGEDNLHRLQELGIANEHNKNLGKTWFSGAKAVQKIAEARKRIWNLLGMSEDDFKNRSHHGKIRENFMDVTGLSARQCDALMSADLVRSRDFCQVLFEEKEEIHGKLRTVVEEKYGKKPSKLKNLKSDIDLIIDIAHIAEEHHRVPANTIGDIDRINRRNLTTGYVIKG